MRAGLKSSILLHSGIFLVLFFGIPVFNHDRSYEAQVVTVEILPVSELSNVKPKQHVPKPDVKKEQITKQTPKISKADPNKVKPAEAAKVEPLPTPIIKKVETKELAELKPVEKPKPKPEEKKEKPKQEEKPQPSEDAFASVLKSVEELRTNEEQKAQEKEEEVDFSEVEDFLSNAESFQYKEGVPLSLSEKDAIRQQIMKNWTVPAGAKDIQNTVVTLYLNTLPDGTISKVRVIDQSRYNSDPFFRAMADSAVRAVYKTNPLKNLPSDKYDVKDGWRELEINFDPKDMVY